MALVQPFWGTRSSSLEIAALISLSLRCPNQGPGLYGRLCPGRRSALRKSWNDNRIWQAKFMMGQVSWNEAKEEKKLASTIRQMLKAREDKHCFILRVALRCGLDMFADNISTMKTPKKTLRYLVRGQQDLVKFRDLPLPLGSGRFRSNECAVGPNKCAIGSGGCKKRPCGLGSSNWGCGS
jgi:hypothetical protein